MYKKFLLFFIIFCPFLFSIIHYTDIDDKLLFKIFHLNEEFSIIKEKHKKELIVINEIEKNLSGITYNENTDTLFAITNSPRDIYELDKSGNILRKISLKGFKDTEDITYIKDNIFAILDEELSSIFIVEIDNNTKVVYRENSLKEFNIDYRYFENFGLEGISYDNIEDEFYIVNERNPKKIISIKGFMTDSNIKINDNEELEFNNVYLSDFSAIHFDKVMRRLYILSDESKILGRVDDKKKFSKYLDLSNDKISSQMTNPEGITKDKEGNFYIVGEPNLFLSIKRDKVLN